MSDSASGGVPPPTAVPPPPPTVVDAHELVVEASAAEHHFAGQGFELVQTVTAGGETVWTVLMQKQPTEKPEPVSDHTAEDH
jgi:hypothetical protein